ncbi:MAG: hypothetical protein D6721_08255 [Gammaproteobacteria bacterium]|nr:MAG: hypothetical protein D6721_08255 [Gammaproteobacteria bacterium]
MTDQPELHSVIVSMVSLAAGIAARHPDMGLCQLERLRNAGVPEHQIRAVIEIARHIRDEASEKLDAAFDEKSGIRLEEPPAPERKPANGLNAIEVKAEGSCCTPTPSGQSCC